MEDEQRTASIEPKKIMSCNRLGESLLLPLDGNAWLETSVSPRAWHGTSQLKSGQPAVDRCLIFHSLHSFPFSLVLCMACSCQGHLPVSYWSGGLAKPGTGSGSPVSCVSSDSGELKQVAGAREVRTAGLVLANCGNKPGWGGGMVVGGLELLYPLLLFMCFFFFPSFFEVYLF